MKERPILFSASMVQAIIAGRKTQTRRAVKPQPKHCADLPLGRKLTFDSACPYGIAGDRLWVKETWKTDQLWDDFRPIDIPTDASILYAADESASGVVPFDWGRGRPSIFMRRWMSRITLELTAVRVERLNEIRATDAVAEGIEARDTELGPFYLDYEWKCQHGSRHEFANPVESFRSLWSSINGPDSWAANPWVWVIEFKRVEKEVRHG